MASDERAKYILLYCGIIIVVVVACIPFSGALIRLRATYLPNAVRRVHLQPEHDRAVEGGTTAAKSYFGMLRTVVRLEGWSGLFKGAWSRIIVLIYAGFLSMVLMIPFVRQTEPSFISSAYKSLILALVFLPGRVLLNRTVVTPYMLPYLIGDKNVLYVLFTPWELRQPWSIYFAPGLLLATAGRDILFAFLLDPLRNKIAHATWELRRSNNEILMHALVLVFYPFIYTLLIVPLEVIFIKLSVQRTHSPGLVLNEDLVSSGEPKRYVHDGDDVVRLREDSEEVPYSGFIDCLIKVINEEGWSALYRCWWLTFAGTAFMSWATSRFNIHGGLAQIVVDMILIGTKFVLTLDYHI